MRACRVSGSGSLRVLSGLLGYVTIGVALNSSFSKMFKLLHYVGMSRRGSSGVRVYRGVGRLYKGPGE